jgi:hypothetical protein
MPLSSSAQYQQRQQQSPRVIQPGQETNAPRPERDQEQAVQPAPTNSQEWDYKASPVNQKGETLPAGAKSWTPFGAPYFGPGLSGTLKKYAWSLMGSPTQGAEGDRWQKFLGLTSTPDFWNNPLSEDFRQAAGTLGQGAMGTSATKQADAAQIKQGNARLKQITDQYGGNIASAPESVQKEYKELQSFWNDPTAALGKVESATSGSLLTPLLRGSKVGMQALMDVLSEASIKFEQAQGVSSAMRDYAEENSALPDFMADVDRKSSEKAEAWQNVGNITSRLVLPMLNTWDAFRFWTAPGTLKQKVEVAKSGYDEGRILYSQAIKPALLEEFKRRAGAGEDPQLLAMELQDPWAEAIGQGVLDPLNVIGMFSKGAKAAGMLDDATDAVRGGSLGDEAAELLGDAGKTIAGPLGETRAAERMSRFDDLVVKQMDQIEKTRLTPDYNKLTAYSPSGLRVRETKVVQTTSSVVTSSIMRNGGSADDVADFMHNLSRAVSTDKTIRMEAWDQIMTMSQRYGMGRYAFSDDVLETGVLLRNLVEDGDLLKSLKAGKGDLAETAKILDSTFRRAVEKQIPTYSEVRKGAEAFKAGTDTTKQASKAAETYAGIKNKALWNLHEGKLGDFKQAVNSFLGKFFFAQPGFVARNASNNLMTMIVDQGLGGTAKSFYRDGKFWSIADIDADLMQYFGGKLPPATSGITLTKSEHAETVVSKLNDAVESGFAKRIYWKQFRDTMDKFMTPGVALPKREEFKAIGMTDEAINHFTHILKNEAYGSVEQAIVKYSEKFGDNGLLDIWKRWNGSVSADEMKGLTELGLTKQLDEIVGSAKTPAEIKSKIAALKRELQTRAASAVDNPIGVNRERKGFEFMETLGKAEKEGLLDVDGSNRLAILIESSEKASDELMQAIGKARDIVQDPAMRQQFGVMEQAFSSSRRGAARTTSQQATETAWELTKRSKKSTGLEVERMWNESILAKRGAPPAGLTPDQFRTELWQATRNEVSNTWEMYFSQGFDQLTPLIDNLTEQFPEMAGIFKKAQKSSAELNMYRTASYRDGKIFYSKPPVSVAELANRYGVSSAKGTAQEGRAVPLDKKLLNEINKYGDVKFNSLDEAEQDLATVERALQNRATAKGVEVKKAAQAAQPELAKAPVTMEEATQIPRGELPPEVSTRFEQEAHRMMDELNSGTGPQVSQPRQGRGGETVSIPSTNVDWYRELPKNLQNKKVLNATLEKIIKDKGSDKGINVERLKEMIIDRFRYGSDAAPPDLKVLKGLGADDKVLQSALDDYNDFTKQELTLDDVLGNKPAGAADEAAALTPDESMPYYDDEGNLINPTNPEVQIAPPYVESSTPIPGQMWKESSDGILAALNKVERHMLDNYGMKAIEKLDGSQLKSLKGLMKDTSGRITEGIAIADKIGKEWRDFALLPYGETRNFDLALSYAFPYQFWYSRSYTNWGKRVATDPAVLANYARLKEAASRINKDSPEWWRYNLEIPSHFLGLPNEHPMSFNLEANIWPLYGLTGTDFNDPQKRTNWLTATIDDVGKFGPSVWSPIQWAVALAYRAKGEEEVAQAWAGRIIPQTATIKAISSYFGQPLELDPAVQIFSGKGPMDFAAMDKYERNRVGRAIGAMIQDGMLTEEQAVEVARTQSGPAWDEAVRRATQIRAPGQIASYLFGVGMKARTEQDRVTDEFYQEYYRLNNMNEAGLVSPEKYQEGWDALRERYPFMDALLLSRKAGPDRDRAYAYNVLGRIPPGQASELYKLAGIDPETARKFYDSKGNMKGWSESEKERFLSAMVDLGATLAIPPTSTRQEWRAARGDYQDMKQAVIDQFGEDIYDKRDYYFSLEGQAKDMYKAAHPEIDAARQLENDFIVNNPRMYQFYGGIETLEKYYDGKVYDALEEKFGDVQPLFDQYYEMQLTNPKAASRFKKANPVMDQYNKYKKGLQQDSLAQILKFADKLPDGPELPLREDFAGGNPTQNAVAGYAAQRGPSPQELQQALGAPLMNIVSQYYADLTTDPSRARLPYQASNELDYKAGRLGYDNGDDLLRDVLLSLQGQ